VIALVLTAWAAILFVLNVRTERAGKEGTQQYHDRDELAERLERIAWRLALVAAALFAVAVIVRIVAGAASDGATAALAVCRERGVVAWDGETTRACLAYADSAAHGGSIADVAATALWVAFAL